MNQIAILNNQSLFDIALRYCGTAEAVWDILMLNGLSITDELIPGQILLIPEKDYGFQEVVNYFIQNYIQPASSLSDLDKELLDDNFGIGTMRIGSTFIVA